MSARVVHAHCWGSGTPWNRGPAAYRCKHRSDVGSQHSSGPRGRQGKAPEKSRDGPRSSAPRAGALRPERMRPYTPPIAQCSGEARRPHFDATAPLHRLVGGPPGGGSAAAPGPRPQGALMTRRTEGEAPVPAQQPEAQEDARLPDPDANPGRPIRPEGPAAEGTGATQRLIWRVRDRATFAAFAGTRRHRHGPLTLTVVEAGDPGDPPRVAYQIGRRVGGAVVRNRVRRRLREAVRAHRELLRPGLAYLIGASPEAARADTEVLSRALEALVAGPSGTDVRTGERVDGNDKAVTA